MTKKAASSWRRWLLFFVLVCLFSLIWSVPASMLPRLLAWSGVNNSNTGAIVEISETRGSLWVGQAGLVHIRNNQQSLVLENVHWQLRWRSLFAAQICLQISSEGAGRMFEGQTCVNTSGQIRVTDMLFEIPATELISTQLAGAALMRSLNDSVQVQGEITGVIEELLWQPDQQQLQVNARGLWSDAAIAMQMPDPQTGRMRLQAIQLKQLPWTVSSRAPDQVFLQVHGVPAGAGEPGDLVVAAQSDIWLDGRFLTRLQLTLQESTPRILRDILMIIAVPQQTGVYQLVWRNDGA
ncbi:MAG: type II secretion system protein N [Pseudohongiella sp.]|nr:type II secretion system protein N [Pseudohongiella sp.]